MAIKTKTFTLLGFILTLLCLIALIVSFASDRWVQSTEKEVSGFKNLGLWSACFEKYRPPPWGLVHKYYDGCWWVLDREMDDLRHYLFPSWFVSTQVLVTLSLVFELIAIIIMVVNAINCFPYSIYRDKITLGISFTAGLLHCLTGIFLMVSVILFGAKADNERRWLESPDQNYLSWGFGMCVLAVFFAFIAMMCQFMEFVRFRMEQGKSDEPVAYLTNKPPPGTSYSYAPANNKSFKTPPRIGRGQPAYVDKYSNHGSQSSLNTKPPDTLFAVSGAGEVYINGLADFDENRQRGRNDRPYSRYEQQSGDRRNNGDHPDSSRRLASKSENYTGNDYEESKQTKHTVLPEYVPASNSNNRHKEDLGATSDDSFELEKKQNSDSDDDQSRDRKKKSESRSTKSRSHSEKGKKKEKKDKNSSVKKSKKHDKEDDSDEDRSRRRSRKDSSSTSKKRGGRSRSRSKHRSHSRDSKHRSRSRDFDTSYSDSERGSIRGRSKRRKDDENISRKDGKRRSASEKNTKGSQRKSSSTDGHKKKRAGNYIDESGSEFNSRLRSRQKIGDWSDVGSERKTKRDFSDSESMRSKSSRRPGDKPKGTYSSYYEY